MTNEVRTLLLNMTQEPTGVTPGEEFVPADFRPAALPSGLQRASTALFGPGADRAGKNLQLARILGYLHSSPLSEYVTAGDARLTYDVARVTGSFDRLGATVTMLSAAQAVGWSGSAEFPIPGRAYGNWIVVTDGAGGYTSTGLTGGTQTGSVVVMDLGDVVPLSGSRLSLVIGPNAAGSWRAELLVPPEYNFTMAAAIGDPESVFRPSRSAAEAAWDEAWASPIAALKAGAFALALAARTRDVLDGVSF